MKSSFNHAFYSSAENQDFNVSKKVFACKSLGKEGSSFTKIVTKFDAVHGILSTTC